MEDAGMTDAHGQTTQPADYPQDSAQGGQLRLLAVGSETWPLKSTVAETLVTWWLANDRPATRLVIEQGAVGRFAADVWDSNKFAVENHPGRLFTRRDRHRRAAMLADGVAHALLFSHGDDPYVDAWIIDLAEAGIPATLISMRGL
jgi:hypothetical protein